MTQPNYELLKDAYQIIDGIPDHLVYLDNIVSRKGDNLTCGTVCCAAGWLAHHPKFKKLGLSIGMINGDYSLKYKGIVYYQNEYDVPMADIFGISLDDTTDLFCIRGEVKNDIWIAEVEGRALGCLTDKELFKRRVYYFLKERGQLTEGGDRP